MMSKRLKIWLVLLLVGAGITAGGAGYMKYQEHKEREAMLEIVKSEEVKSLCEEAIKNIDENSFTTEGLIQSYQIDYDSISHNPMGGIDFDLIINNDKKIRLDMGIDKNPETGELENLSGSQSAELADLLKEKNE
ncbi:DUF1310 family protein [Streptococcus chenjunshii]|uniref:DUF1310 family protein n=1 Tax=Streptococcus chenjunshii TaxID=2173853 RepID=A0A346NB40_9STRE|nr:DUF1310 family protein [Streptococcus chenjunshii]AXQ77870.1 DUF1310 family protein [Streptococcus chenjunshii]AXQ78235.1 DUF1310 family protein [Streptococcus chenjunshii]RFU49929.1 DUF1310 family protein [Streptococcus chenjunshii]RFU52122.1 DUF1310 family protein [Streptococcus chenjunshii]